MTTLSVDREFRSLIPPLSGEEYAGLEASLLEFGCRDALIVWDHKGRTIILDGHHRNEICRRHKLETPVEFLELETRDDAAAWIDKNQLARRNLTPDQAAIIRGRMYNRTKKQGARTDLTSGQNAQKSWTAEYLAEGSGVSEKTIRRDAKFVAENPDAVDAVLRGETTIRDVKRGKKEAARESRRASNAKKVEKSKSVETLQSAFSTIMIDPPWDWGDEGDHDQLGRARPTYHTMSIEELRNLPIGKLADRDAHLYLWITNRSLPKGFDLMERWGFRYITTLTWCKPSFGMGNYFRGSTEHILFGVRGSLPLKKKNVGTWFEAARGPEGHSSKPIAAYELVESCSPGPYLEMFSRQERDGWAMWGEDG